MHAGQYLVQDPAPEEITRLDAALERVAPGELRWWMPGRSEANQWARGLGDAIAGVLKRAGVQPCGGCKKRQEWLNEKVPF